MGNGAQTWGATSWLRASIWSWGRCQVPSTDSSERYSISSSSTCKTWLSSKGSVAQRLASVSLLLQVSDFNSRCNFGPGIVSDDFSRSEDTGRITFRGLNLGEGHTHVLLCQGLDFWEQPFLPHSIGYDCQTNLIMSWTVPALIHIAFCLSR